MATTTAVKKRSGAGLQTIKAKIEQRVKLSDALLRRAGYSPEVFERVALNALVQNPGLGSCSVESVEKAVMQCCELGLLPDGTEAVIFPGRPHARLVPMIAGRIKLARQALPGLVLRARVVYRSDEWEHSEGLEPVLRHIPDGVSPQNDDDLVAAYALARIPGADEPEWEVLYRPALDRARGRSSNPGGPWKSHFPEMCEKTVLGLLLKRLPRHPVAAAHGIDVYGDDGGGVYEAPVVDVPADDEEVVAAEVVAEREPPPVRKAAPRRPARPRQQPEPDPEPEPEPAPDPEPEPDFDADESPF